jgi:transposase-like protein
MKCKHIRAVELSFILRKIVAQEPMAIQPVNALACLACQSVRVVKHGIRHNGYRDIQQFLCRGCGRAFVVNLGFERMKAGHQAITQAMQLYFTGESLRNVQKFLRLQGVNVSHVTVLKWIQKYVGLMQRYLDKLTPQVGDVWRTDELFLKVKGNLKYLFAMMDDDTRFWIAQQVSDTKGTSDVRPMFREAQERAGKNPKYLISDGAPNFAEANIKEWWTQRKEGRVSHLRDIRIDGTVRNNKMERLNGEFRDREKVMRGWRVPLMQEPLGSTYLPWEPLSLLLTYQESIETMSVWLTVA